MRNCFLLVDAYQQQNDASMANHYKDKAISILENAKEASWTTQLKNKYAYLDQNADLDASLSLA